MTPGPRTRTLIRLGNAARARRMEAEHGAVTRAAAELGFPAEHAEYTGEEESFALWALPRAGLVAYVYPPEHAWQAQPLMADAHRVGAYGLDVLLPRSDRAVAAGGRFVTFWERPRGRRVEGDASAAAYAAAALHLLPPLRPSAAGDHDPFEGMLDGLEQAPLRPGDADWIRRRAVRLADLWCGLAWPSPPTTILAGHQPATCYRHLGTRQLVLTRPLVRGQREWDVAAARWRSDLVQGYQGGYREFVAAYAQFCPAPSAGADPADWEGYPVLREVLALGDTMREVRRTDLGGRHQREVLHRLACLRGEAGPAPWRWSAG
ncbi:hypothetical protein ACIA8O_03360 [Kitasatospora sp. NPDC051853]|uniref:hypothetical protein n=1 Tax=Kitasatospora sp. NPDC051853 TaxID=3364058 RepID=UPI00378D655A